MSIRVPSRNALFGYLHANNARYVVLRDSGDEADDIDVLIDDEMIARLGGAFPSRRGIKTDVYGVRGAMGAYHGFTHLPPALGQQILACREYTGSYWVPRPDHELAALLYHIAYHKPEQSGFAVDDASRGVLDQPYGQILKRLCDGLKREPPVTLQAIHQELAANGLAVDFDRLAAYVQHDFSAQRKCMFHAVLMNQWPGEFNLFVIRAIAVRHGLAGALLERLRDEYQVLMVKPVPFWTRITRAKHMRGGKWRRGGKPHLAVAVFDNAPIVATTQERQKHPFVFNARQFVKQSWRTWFTEQSSARAKDNPIHSTDNEAEAIGHLPLFFSSKERAQLLFKIKCLHGLDRAVVDAT